MEKLLRGIIDYRNNVRPTIQKKMAAMAYKQNPDAILVACADSRVAPNVFASTNPGDLFVLRNIGNIVPPKDQSEGTSEGAALDFMLSNFTIKDIIICGHSNCGAMACAFKTQENLPKGSWLSHAKESLKKAQNAKDYLSDTPSCDSAVLSMINTLQQIEHLKTYPLIQQRVNEGSLTLHAWWFDIEEADVLEYDTQLKKFVLIGEKYKYLSASEKTL